MCRFFALRADRPVGLESFLVTAPHALVRQSCCDRRGECHENGWGIGWYADGRPQRVRSVRPAAQDPLFAETAGRIRATTAIAHVRQASVGAVAERNCHPFTAGPWTFAHNGTLEGFDTDPDRLRRLIPEPYRSSVEGETDSAQVFQLLLARLGDRRDAETVGRVVSEAVAELAALYPGSEKDPTRLNVVLTDGEVMAVTRWGHSLSSAVWHGPGRARRTRMVTVASEPPSRDGWADVEPRTLLLIHNDLTVTVRGIGS